MDPNPEFFFIEEHPLQVYGSCQHITFYKYFEISDGGNSATVGVQSNRFYIHLINNLSILFKGSSSGPTITYSVDQANSILPNTTLIFDTNTGTYSG